MALGGGRPIQRASALDLSVPSPTRTRSGRRPPSILTDTDETDLKPRDGEEFVEKLRAREDGLRLTIDPEGRLTHDETSVDVVTVPCPGAHPLRSWNRDGLMGRYFGAPSMRDAEVHEAERQNPSWVRQGIRREASRARILLYEHPEVVEGTTLNTLAIALLDELKALRTRERQQERPLLFIGHSIGGLVVKMALVRASRDAKYEGILRECYGVAFFGESDYGVGISECQAGMLTMPSSRNAAPGVQLLRHADLGVEHPAPASAIGPLACIADGRPAHGKPSSPPCRRRLQSRVGRSPRVDVLRNHRLSPVSQLGRHLLHRAPHVHQVGHSRDAPGTHLPFAKRPCQHSLVWETQRAHSTAVPAAAGGKHREGGFQRQRGRERGEVDAEPGAKGHGRGPWLL